MKRATTPQLLRAVFGLERGNLAVTLAYCLFWSQFASQERDGQPAIYKTGAEIAGEVPIAPRTANTHLKTLARKGYWTLEYRPKPGGVGNVTWLVLTEKSVALVRMARDIDLAARRRRKAGSTTSDGAFLSPPNVTKSDIQMSENVTSIQTKTSAKTAGKSFILTAKVGQEKMKETSSCHSQGTGNDGPKPPGYVKVNLATEHLANGIAEHLEAKHLPPWDWTSQFTWKNTAEVEHKLAKRGMDDPASLLRLIKGLTMHWNWLRHVMDNRYSQHSSNLHWPSPMALAHQFDKLLPALESKWIEEAKDDFVGPILKVKSNLGDEEFFS